MSHKAVRDLLSDTAKQLSDNIYFDYSAVTDFNAVKDKKAPFIHADLFKITPTIVHNSISSLFETTLLFYQLDDPQGATEDTAVILDQMGLLMDQYVRKLNKTFILPDDGTVTIISSDSVELTFGTAQPMRKVLTDCLTGWMLDLKIACPDDFDYCSIYDS